MEALVKLTSKGLQSSSGLTQEWKTTYTKTSGLLKKLFTKMGCANIKLTRGHFYLSGFLTAPNGEIFYINLSSFDMFGIENMLIRTAKDYKDFTGGSNNYVSINNIEEDLKRIIK